MNPSPPSQGRPSGQDEVLADAAARLLRDIDAMVADFEGDHGLTDPGCRQCTFNTTPHDRDTGLCGYHATRAALSRATPASDEAVVVTDAMVRRAMVSYFTEEEIMRMDCEQEVDEIAGFRALLTAALGPKP